MSKAIETSSRASSATSFTGIDIDLRSNLGSAISRVDDESRKISLDPLINVKSLGIKKHEQVPKAENSIDGPNRIPLDAILNTTQSSQDFSIPRNDDYKNNDINQPNFNKEIKYNNYRYILASGFGMGIFVLTIGIIFGFLGALNGNLNGFINYF